MADLYAITPQGGATVYWTAADTNLVHGGQTYTASHEAGTQPVMERGAIRNKRGTETQTLDLTLYQGQSAQFGGVALALAAANGAFDLARVRVDRMVMPTWGSDAWGTIELFEGNVAGLDASSWKTVLHVKSDLEKLGYKWPRILFLDRCANVFCDAACGLSRSAYLTTGTVQAGSDQNTIQTGITADAADYFDGGLLVMTSGVCSGSRRTVATSTAAGAVALSVPLPAGVAAGDAFQISAGCARTQAACTAYGNLTRYRGFPYLPVAETAR